MEQLINSFKEIDKNLLGILITSLIAFLSWLVKGLIETPLKSSEKVFYKFLEKRIEYLSEVKVRLSLIAYFPNEKGKMFKEQIQDILLKDGKSAYLSSETLQDVLKISISEDSDEKLILATIDSIDIDLATQINKIQETTNFFTKYSNLNPSKKIISYFLLVFYYSISICTIFFIIAASIYLFIIFTLWAKIVLGIMILSILYFLNKWINS